VTDLLDGQPVAESETVSRIQRHSLAQEARHSVKVSSPLEDSSHFPRDRPWPPGLGRRPYPQIFPVDEIIERAIVDSVVESPIGFFIEGARSLREPGRFQQTRRSRVNTLYNHMSALRTCHSPANRNGRVFQFRLNQDTTTSPRVESTNPMTASLKGIVHGKVIELDQEPGLPDGQEVSVTLQPISPGSSHVPSAPGHDLPSWQGQVLGKLTRDEIYDDRA
jgi:hypothetical protein